MRNFNNIDMQKVIGGLGYLGNSAISGHFTWSGLGTSIAAGAVSGIIGGPMASTAAKYLAPRVGFLSGAAIGIADKK
ncbi:hypothetical protein C3007_10025 [Avibacterium gallinarum]|uniref:Uncharacterized protein n=1 Tax=Avibacterium gallinarum TaxID=755 RepID=A0A379AZE8_AVIGA|nr:hypothetical protein [Avibacterium gallinarum]POY43488.1 hypothetical protein C3007_10025 [Avibacterium gallinarum]TDP27538.1 hypothetical protein EV689_11158 [Avibacterium gallinarum]SUB27809.1 Uncharacterised protein [Avibacterium gallinarum]